MGPCPRYALESTSMGTKSSPNHRRFPGSLMMARLIGHTNEGSKAHTISRFENPFPSLPGTKIQVKVGRIRLESLGFPRNNIFEKMKLTSDQSVQNFTKKKKTGFCKKTAPGSGSDKHLLAVSSACRRRQQERSCTKSWPGEGNEDQTKSNLQKTNIWEKDNLDSRVFLQGCGYQLDNCIIK